MGLTIDALFRRSHDGQNSIYTFANVRSAVRVFTGEAGVTFVKHLRFLRKNTQLCFTNN